MGALSQLRSPCRILGQYGSLPKVFIYSRAIIPLIPSSLELAKKWKKRCQVSSQRFFQKGIILSRPWLLLKGFLPLCCEYNWNLESHNPDFSLFLMKYIQIYRDFLKISFLFFVALLLVKCYWKALSILTSFEVLDQGLLVILNISWRIVGNDKHG